MKQLRIQKIITPLFALMLTFLVDDLIDLKGITIPGVAAQNFKFNFGGGG
jgi:hypothetical protein